MNKTVITIGLVGGGLFAAWYFFLRAPRLQVTSLDPAGKKTTFLYSGKSYTYDFSNPNYGQVLETVPGYTLSISYQGGVNPNVHWYLRKGTQVIRDHRVYLSSPTLLNGF